MGGGVISKEKFVNNDGTLCHYFNICDYNLCGGTSPIYLSSLDQLKKDNVGLIITTLLEPLHSGKTINHRPFDHDRTEWTQGDDGIEDKIKELGIELLHIPIQDGCPLIDTSTTKLLEYVNDFTKRRPNDKIYVHCWVGAGRTSIVLILILNQIYGIPLKDSYQLVSKYNKKIKLTSQYQMPYFDLDKNISYPLISSDLYKNFYNCDIRTPLDHACYKI